MSILSLQCHFSDEGVARVVADVHRVSSARAFRNRKR